MSNMYGKKLPLDEGGNAMQGYPAPVIAVASYSGVPVSSSTIGLSDKTTTLEVAAVGGPLLLRWGASGASTTAFDHIISKDTTRRFVVPRSVMGTSSVAGANVALGLHNKYAVIAATVSASIFAAEY